MRLLLQFVAGLGVMLVAGFASWLVENGRRMATQMPWWFGLVVVAVGSSLAFLFAISKSWMDRRQHLNDMTSLLRAELENVERHARTARETLGGAATTRAGIERTKFPETGLIALSAKDLLGNSQALIQDVMTLVISLRNLNITIDRGLAEMPLGRLRRELKSEAIRRLRQAETNAHRVRSAMAVGRGSGGVVYREPLLITRGRPR